MSHAKTVMILVDSESRSIWRLRQRNSTYPDYVH